MAGEGVRGAVAFQAGGNEWIAAAAAPDAEGPFRIVLLHRAGPGAWRQVATDLRAGFPSGSAAPREGRWGVEDADGDGEPDVYAAQVSRWGAGYRVDLRVHAPAAGAGYRLVVPGRPPGGLDDAQRDFSFDVMDRPDVRRWLARRAEAVARDWIGPRAAPRASPTPDP